MLSDLIQTDKQAKTQTNLNAPKEAALAQLREEAIAVGVSHHDAFLAMEMGELHDLIAKAAEEDHEEPQMQAEATGTLTPPI